LHLTQAKNVFLTSEGKKSGVTVIYLLLNRSFFSFTK
jgi:hypothetical protein